MYCYQIKSRKKGWCINIKVILNDIEKNDNKKVFKKSTKKNEKIEQ